MNKKKLAVLAFGTYDTGKPRTRILIKGIRQCGIKVIECHVDIWKGLEDKSQIKGYNRIAKTLLQWFFSYPRLLKSYFNAKRHDFILICYPGLIDIFIIFLFAKIRGIPIILDLFIPFYNMIVEDRKLINCSSLLAKLIFMIEFISVRLADLVIVDTFENASYIAKKYQIPLEKVHRIFVGAEPEIFGKTDLITPNTKDRHLNVLFYGQFIPLHGIETIIKAAKILESEEIRIKIIGKGQEASKIKMLMNELDPKNITWIEWVRYEELVFHLKKAHVVLGIFGKTQKAQRVIPNKVFQILLAERPLITSDTPAVRELLSNGRGIYLIPPGDPDRLASAILNFRDNCSGKSSLGLHSEIIKKITPNEIGHQFVQMVNNFI